MNNNFLNFSKDEIDAPIYRVFTQERLFQVFNDSQLTLVKPKKWNDPFENHIMNATGELESGERFQISFRENFYGQCWTRTRESDAIWRIYAPKEDGIRVTTTPRKLLKSLYDNSGTFKDINSFIGKVQYWTTNELLIQLNSAAVSSMLLDSTGVGQAQTLLFKRKPFKHENEVRLIYNSHGNTTDDLFRFKINPNELFDDIVFDPRMKFEVFRNFKMELQKKGFKKRIVKSILYKVPKLTFKLHTNS